MGARKFLGLLCLLLAGFLLALPASAAVTVILVRHAEKAASPAVNPPLTDQGKRRAQALADTLAGSGVAAIYETEYVRTQQTAEPLATRLHIIPKRIPGKNSDELVTDIRQHKDGVIVVVGHSNTVPEIISKLGGPAVKIDDWEHDWLYVLTLSGQEVSMVRLHYGEKSEVAAAPPNTPMLEPVRK